MARQWSDNSQSIVLQDNGQTTVRLVFLGRQCSDNGLVTQWSEKGQTKTGKALVIQ